MLPVELGTCVTCRAWYVSYLDSVVRVLPVERGTCVTWIAWYVCYLYSVVRVLPG